MKAEDECKRCPFKIKMVDELKKGKDFWRNIISEVLWV